ncbi:hypothetical protein [Streptomyces halobius]|uniref:Uncharacterized protein n=1 Tax=Streptomyces halobius TaxID=2879846 RepID=A0ABY4MLI9_9ACTN|nr:hypothetical protein [Streptomyces halobius]UQA98212.1 hypothetical protein K9S39_41410 [Streptomyces halobius]
MTYRNAKALLLDDGGDLSAALDAALCSRGWRTSRLRIPGAAPGDRDGQPRTWALEDWEEATLSGDSGSGASWMRDRSGCPSRHLAADRGQMAEAFPGTSDGRAGGRAPTGRSAEDH